MNQGSRKWIKLWVDPWLSSTMRFTLDHKQRAVWADLLALGGQSRISGVICAGEEEGKVIGFPLSRIAGAVDVPDLKELSEMLHLFEKQERITVEKENGRVIIRLLNWSKYQAEYTRQNRYKARKKQEKPQATHMATPLATHEATGGGYGKATPTEVEVEEVQNHCANPSGSHGSDPLLPPVKPADEHLKAVLRVWAHYLEKLDKNPKLLSFTSLRKQKGLARLKECLAKTGDDLTKAEGLLRLAVDALAASAFHRGDNDRKRRYDSWERNLFTSQEQLERWLEQT